MTGKRNQLSVVPTKRQRATESVDDLVPPLGEHELFGRATAGEAERLFRFAVRQEVAALLAEAPSNTLPRSFLKPSELAQVLNVSTRHVANLTDDGMPYYPVGADRRYKLEEVLPWLRERGIRAAKEKDPRE